MNIKFHSELTTQLNKTHKILDPIVLQNISVTAPYFALSDIVEMDEYIVATVPRQLNDLEEKLPITIPEVGRHMAIMGCLALSKVNPLKEKHYYLATEAVITRNSIKESNNPTLKGRVKVQSIDKKNGSVVGELYDADQQLVCEVEFKYILMHYRLFERLFAPFKMETVGFEGTNPYTENPVFETMELGMQNCYATLSEIQPENCLGHFDHYPAMPVARLGAAMGKVGAAHFQYANPAGFTDRYGVIRTEIKANRLVFVGEKVHFKSEILDPNPGKGMIIQVNTFNEKQEVVASSVTHFYY